jgi:hypothetical protein
MSYIAADMIQNDLKHGVTAQDVRPGTVHFAMATAMGKASGVARRGRGWIACTAHLGGTVLNLHAAGRTRFAIARQKKMLCSGHYQAT